MKTVEYQSRFASSTPSPAEFDEFSAGYDAMPHHLVWSLAGKDSDRFMTSKARLLAHRIASDFPPQHRENLRLLDYGCGTGSMLRHLRRLGFQGGVAGCDISPGMLREAEFRWDLPHEPAPTFKLIEQSVAPFTDGAFDAIVACCVLHHVPPRERTAFYADIARLLAPGGRFYVFEHNPWNPLTQFVVRRAPVDRDAVLLSSREARTGMRRAGLSPDQPRYFMFLPPRWQWTQRAEAALAWLPLGAQYLVSATMPDSGRGQDLMSGAKRTRGAAQ